MRVWLEQSAGDGIWTIRHDDVRLADSTAIDEWRTLLLDELQSKVGSQRVPLLIDLSGFSLDPALAPAYGPVAKKVVSEYATVAVRYGPEGTLTSASLRTAAIKQGFASNICDSRETAVELLGRLQNSPPLSSPNR